MLLFFIQVKREYKLYTNTAVTFLTGLMYNAKLYKYPEKQSMQQLTFVY